MVVAVVGIGLIGGSLALALKKHVKNVSQVIGVDTNEQHISEAIDLQIIDQALPLEAAIKASDVIVLAVPVNYAAGLAPKILDLVNKRQILLDVGSTKGDICSAVADHPMRKCFVATHPMAGTENSGPSAAFDSLFTNKLTVICELEKSFINSLRVVEKIFDDIGMSIVHMDPFEHDMHIAYVSHISHITSFALGQTVLEIEKDEKSIFNMASTGFASTVRLAKSSPAMWAPIFKQNGKNITNALDAYIKNLVSFKEMIEEGRQDDLYEFMHKANDIRRVLEGIELKDKRK